MGKKGIRVDRFTWNPGDLVPVDEDEVKGIKPPDEEEETEEYAVDFFNQDGRVYVYDDNADFVAERTVRMTRPEGASVQRVGITLLVEGGPGSGNYGHKGIPGQQGGSLPSQTAAAIDRGEILSADQIDSLTKLHGKKMSYYGPGKLVDMEVYQGELPKHNWLEVRANFRGVYKTKDAETWLKKAMDRRIGAKAAKHADYDSFQAGDYPGDWVTAIATFETPSAIGEGKYIASGTYKLTFGRGDTVEFILEGLDALDGRYQLSRIDDAWILRRPVEQNTTYPEEHDIDATIAEARTKGHNKLLWRDTPGSDLRTIDV